MGHPRIALGNALEQRLAAHVPRRPELEYAVHRSLVHMDPELLVREHGLDKPVLVSIHVGAFEKSTETEWHAKALVDINIVESFPSGQVDGRIVHDIGEEVFQILKDLDVSDDMGWSGQNLQLDIDDYFETPVYMQDTDGKAAAKCACLSMQYSLLFNI